MSVILIMLPAALLLAGIGVAAFIFAAKRGQFDDLDTPAIRAVFDDDDTLATHSQEGASHAHTNPHPDDDVAAHAHDDQRL